ncbi:hypothetical protein DXA01_16255 [Bacteroides caccae]|nr:hypothetical protein DXA01_16255 [Bacteroides caccae]
MKTLTWQKPGQQNVAQELIKIIINYVAELRIETGKEFPGVYLLQSVSLVDYGNTYSAFF